MRDGDDRKKRTPKRKEKRRKASAVNSIAASDQNYESPYTDTTYKVPNIERNRNGSKLNLQSSSLINENGVIVDTLFPSEHLVAMSIAEHEQNDFDQLESIAEDPDPHIHEPAASPSIIVTDYPLTTNQVMVKDPNTKEEVATKCIANREDSVFVGPAGGEPKPTDPYVLSRCLIQKGFGSGVLLLRPMEIKPTQLVSRGELIFQLWYGRVSLTIHETTMVIVSGDFFFVPRGNTYSIKNLRNEEAKFSYTVVKGVDPEKEAADKELMERRDRESKMGQWTAREGTYVTVNEASILDRPTIGEESKDNITENITPPKSLEQEETTNKDHEKTQRKEDITKDLEMFTLQPHMEPPEII